ncbi:ABC transporter substrate-binding protein [Stackebrandtia nassauensis]|uniref:Extracellular solute-binding protein family 1 n=1 Tax=Stackebrandtia nassauensis (strain DSM 44728 / CIP 108903 / NRRL B-16338 / NBRC 102104 / LLR-40K-21) TaxID=446470 RepID=D3Q0H2_STANL|nr:extracellular solute-binding protein [Stackebrandtia nassauensis]ADD41708.1 extracellular solute-binding protein family 1 [Stackebrandtia nassauensis DSM 44728]
MRAKIATLAALVMLAATGCGLSGEDSGGDVDVSGEVTGKVSLQTWALKPKHTKYVEKLIDGFEDKYPGTKVKWLDQPGDGYSEKVLNQAANDELPDVVNLPPEFALPLADKELLLDVADTDDKLKKDYLSGAIDAYRFPGVKGAYGYPWYLNTDVNYWNADLMKKYGLDPDKPPTSFEDLVAQAKTMKKKSDGKMFLMSRKPSWEDLTNAGVEILSSDGEKFTFNTDAAAELLDGYRDAYADGLLPDDVLTDAYLGNSELFKQKKVAWSTGGGNFINDVKVDNPKLAKDIVPSKALDTPPLYVQGLSVSKKSDNLPTAVALARWVTNADNQADFAERVPGIFPSTTASADDESFSESDGSGAGDAKKLAFESLAEAELLKPVVVDDAINDVFNQQISLAVSGETSSKQALDKAAEECTKLLND